MPPTSDPVLTRFRAALDALYGDRIERVVLHGSRARGDARPDSNYDVDTGASRQIVQRRPSKPRRGLSIAFPN